MIQNAATRRGLQAPLLQAVGSAAWRVTLGSRRKRFLEPLQSTAGSQPCPILFNHPAAGDSIFSAPDRRLGAWGCYAGAVMRFRVSFFQDGEYEVFQLSESVWESVFIGRLADCEAYIRLKQNEQVDF